MNIPQIVLNSEKLYEGDLVRYLKVLFYDASNATLPYHNFRHMLHVTWLCYQGCEFYRETLSPREMRDILIAALFHDYDHTGSSQDDGKNITRAIAGVRGYIGPEDKLRMGAIVGLIRATEFPYTVADALLTLPAKILRDADMCQGLDSAWIQQIVFGLASEKNQKPIEVLQTQKSFLSNLQFYTKWAQALFPQTVIDARLEEVRQLLRILEPVVQLSRQR